MPFVRAAQASFIGAYLPAGTVPTWLPFVLKMQMWLPRRMLTVDER
jgi:hypothetical protein